MTPEKVSTQDRLAADCGHQPIQVSRCFADKPLNVNDLSAVGVPIMCATINQREVPQHLYRPNHGHSQNWYVRLVPPRQIQCLVGTREYRKSTGTADLRRAKTVAAVLIAEKRREWNQLLANGQEKKVPSSTVLSSALIEHVCAKRLYQWLRLDDAARVHGQGFTEADVQRSRQVCNVTDQAMRSVLARGASSPEWKEVIRFVLDWCETIGYSVATTDPLFPFLVREIARADLQAQGLVVRRNSDVDAPTPPEPEPYGGNLSALVALYCAYKGEKTGRKHASTSTNILLLLLDHRGNVPLDTIKSNDLHDFIAARLHAEHKPWSSGYARGLVKRTLREAFGLARARGLMRAENPIDSLDILPKLSKVEEQSRKKPRFPFSGKQMTALFASPWYDPDATLWRGKMRTDLGARYWVPLICLFHGTRVVEALQLKVSDFALDGSTPTMQFQTDVEVASTDGQGLPARSLKNASAHRIVPVHPTLVEFGLSAFVAKRENADGSSAFLFPSSLPEPGGTNPLIGRAYQQAFLRHLYKAMKFPHGFGNHSFRHQLEDRIRDAQTLGNKWPPGLARSYTGRKRLRQDDVFHFEEEGSDASYGKDHSPSTMVQYISRLNFSDVVLPKRFAQWLDKAQ